MHDIPELDSKGLRNFGVVTGTIFAALFGLLFPWLLDYSSPYWPWILGGVLIAWGIIAPDSLDPLYRGWMRLALLLSKITTPIVLGLVFFLVLLPMGLGMRLFRQDPMARQFDAAVKSYRVESRRANREDMERPY